MNNLPLLRAKICSKTAWDKGALQTNIRKCSGNLWNAWGCKCVRSLMVKCRPSKSKMRIRFPPYAPICGYGESGRHAALRRRCFKSVEVQVLLSAPIYTALFFMIEHRLDRKTVFEKDNNLRYLV